MKKTSTPRPRKVKGMASEYHFDYKKGKPNRFAKKMKEEPVIVLLKHDTPKLKVSAADRHGF